MPAVVAFFFVKKMLPAVLIALPVGILGSVGGLMISYFAPPLSFAHAHESPNGVEAAGLGGWPTGPSIVIAIGAVAILSYLIKLFIPDKPNEESVNIEPIGAE
jgi:ABC-type Mn2+/Zn2+ transport system permease subunit